MINIVHALSRVGPVLQVYQVLDRPEDIVTAESKKVSKASGDRFLSGLLAIGHRDMFFAVEIEFVVQLQTTDQREVVTLRIKEEVVEQVRSRFQRRRITGTQSAINLDHRFALAQGFVGDQGVADCSSGGQRVQEEKRKFINSPRLEVVEVLLGQFLVALHEDFASSFINDVHGSYSLNRIDPDQVAEADWDPFDFSSPELPSGRLGEFLILSNNDITGRVLQFLRATLADQVFRFDFLLDLLAIDFDCFTGVKVLQKILGLIPQSL